LTAPYTPTAETASARTAKKYRLSVAIAMAAGVYLLAGMFLLLGIFKFVNRDAAAVATTRAYRS